MPNVLAIAEAIKRSNNETPPAGATKDTNDQNAQKEEKIRFKDFVLPVIAGAIAGISPKAAQAVNIATRFYTDLGNLRRAKEQTASLQQKVMAERQQEDTKRQNIQRILESFASGQKMRPSETALQLMLAGVPEDNIPKLIPLLHGADLNEAIEAYKSLPPGAAFQLPLAVGGSVGRNVSQQFGSPEVQTVYDPKSNATQIHIIQPSPVGEQPNIVTHQAPGVPASAAGVYIRESGSSSTPAGVSSGGVRGRASTRYKPIVGIDQTTGMPLTFMYNQETGEIKPTNIAPANQKPSGGRVDAKFVNDMVSAIQRAIQAGDDQLAQRLQQELNNYLNVTVPSSGGASAPTGTPPPQMTPEEEARIYLSRKFGGRQ